MSKLSTAEIHSIFGSVKAHAKRISGRFVEMDDLVQVTMEKILKAKIVPKQPTDKYLFSCTWNARNDILRKIYWERENRDFVAPVDTVRLSYEEDSCSVIPSVVYEPSDPYLAQRINQAIARLSDVQRKVFLLYVTGHSYLQIAEATNTNVNTVRTRLYFARSSLRRNLSSCI